jgi:hypothetical protein
MMCDLPQNIYGISNNGIVILFHPFGHEWYPQITYPEKDLTHGVLHNTPIRVLILL